MPVTCPACGHENSPLAFGSAPARPVHDRICPGCGAVLELPTGPDPGVTVLHGPVDEGQPTPDPDGRADR